MCVCACFEDIVVALAGSGGVVYTFHVNGGFVLCLMHLNAHSAEWVVLLPD
jgi:hypothetical protein